jgi:hypothetical protein
MAATEKYQSVSEPSAEYSLTLAINVAEDLTDLEEVL